MNGCTAKIIGKMIVKHIYFSVKRYKYSIYLMVSTVLMSFKEITGSIS